VEDLLKLDLETMSVDWSDTSSIASNHATWRLITTQCLHRTGGMRSKSRLQLCQLTDIVHVTKFCIVL